MLAGLNTAKRIALWSPEDRPIERLRSKGKESLSPSELLAILIGSGSPGQDALSLSRQILESVDNSLPRLSELSVEELLRFRGIGHTKAVRIVACLELASRRIQSRAGEARIVRSSQDAYLHIKAQLETKEHEEFWLILLNRRNQVLRTVRVSQGGLSGTVADPKRIFKVALDQQASGIILAHNHPSGNLSASQADRRITQRLQRGAAELDIQLLDHLIVTYGSYLSFADEGML